MSGQNSQPEYSVVVPVFENTESVGTLTDRLRVVFEEMLQTTYEIILVEDGSKTSSTWDVIREIAQDAVNVRAIRLMRNFGKPAAIVCGLAHTRGSWIVTIDDDLQQRPEDIVELVKHRSHDVVVAKYPIKEHGLSVRWTSYMKGKFDRYILKLPFRMTPLKLLKREVVREMLRVHTSQPYIPALIRHATMDFHAVTLEHQASHLAASRYNLIRRLRQFSNLIIGNSSFMLRSLALLGLVVFGAASLLMIYVAFIHTGGSRLLYVIGAINLLLSGVVLTGLGVIGEYLRRLIDLGSDKSAYSIRETIRIEHEAGEYESRA
jgi:glycosyltransferase involved in cell wall biosynthesis